jgi:hypothetical protein
MTIVGAAASFITQDRRQPVENEILPKDPWGWSSAVQPFPM